jgi:hypothetical protein
MPLATDSSTTPTIKSRNSRAVLLYLMLLLAHLAHILEEVWGHFQLMDRLFGEGWFLVANWVLFCIPVFFFYNWLRGKKWARTWSLLYAGFMMANGFGHNIATAVTGRYKGGFAGGFSGIALFMIGFLLIRKILREGRCS